MYRRPVAFLKLQHNLSANADLQLKLYAADGSGFPTGAVLSTSNIITFLSGSRSGEYEFSFPASERVELITSTPYCVVLDAPKSDLTEANIGVNSSRLGLTSLNTAIAQSITFNKSGYLKAFDIYLDYQAFQYTQTLIGKIWTDSPGLPNTLVASTATISLLNVSAIKGKLTFIFAGNGVAITAGTKYWIGIDGLTITQDDIEPIAYGDVGSDWVSLYGSAAVPGQYRKIISQSWLQTFSATADSVRMKVHHDTFGITRGASFYIYTANASGILITPIVGPIDYAFLGSFLGEFIVPISYTFIQGTYYAIAWYSATGFMSVDATAFFKMVGKANNPYAAGIAYEYSDINGYQSRNQDCYFKIHFPNVGYFYDIYGDGADADASNRAAIYTGGAWQLMAANKDLYISRFMKSYKNNWSVWGKDANPFANVIPSDKIEGIWTSKAPKDFYIKAKILAI